ncbi:MAG: DUF421 domain-containing protein [Parafilimonas sp.]|nr:DUF421 domain-containing protein [Parafilimonas sp.]
MDKSDIFWNDWQRILIGQVPGPFFIEVILRMIVVYFILVFSMRAMGKRMATQLTITEYASLVSLAAATGMAVQTPERGLLPAMLIAAIVIYTQRFIAKRASVNNRFEKLLMGEIDILVEDGKLNIPVMHHTRITREKLFSKMRNSSIKHLGEVQRLYFEASGDFALIKAKEPKPGLSVIPNWDKKMRDKQKREPGICVCKTCGNIKHATIEQRIACDNCGNEDTEYAVL